MSNVLDDLPGGDVKIGGKSVYLYAAAIAAVAVIYMWWNGRNSSVASTNVEGQDYITVPGVSGDLGDLPKAAVIDPADYETPEPTNAEWMVKSMAYLATLGVSPLKAQVAIQKYFDGEQLNYDETTILNKAVAEFGPPPQGLYGPPLITTEKPATAPAPTPAAPAAPAPKAKAASGYTPHAAKYVVKQTEATYFDSPGGKATGTAKKGDTVTTTVKKRSGATLWVGTDGGRWFRESALAKR